MKINKIYSAYGNNIESQAQKNRDNTAKDKNIKEEKSEDVQISKAARKLMEEINQAKSTDFSEKVEKIRQAVLESNYQVSSEEIGDKILQSIDLQKESEE